VVVAQPSLDSASFRVYVLGDSEEGRAPMSDGAALNTLSSPSTVSSTYR
jgi:hypothetical protein